MLGKACMCDTCHTHNISFALSSKQEREESFGHNKKRLKRRTKWSFFGEKMEEKGGFYGRYGPRLFFFVIKVEKYNKMGPLKLRTNKCTRFRRVQERSGLLIKKKGKGECVSGMGWPLPTCMCVPFLFTFQ